MYVAFCVDNGVVTLLYIELSVHLDVSYFIAIIPNERQREGARVLWESLPITRPINNLNNWYFIIHFVSLTTFKTLPSQSALRSLGVHMSTKLTIFLRNK